MELSPTSVESDVFLPTAYSAVHFLSDTVAQKTKPMRDLFVKTSQSTGESWMLKKKQTLQRFKLRGCRCAGLPVLGSL